MMPHQHRSQIRFLTLLLWVAVFLAIGRVFHFDPASLQSYLRGVPAIWSGLIFVFLYVGLTFLVWVGPKDVLRVAGAFVFGPYWSTAIIWAAELGNACVMFSMSRHFGREYVAERMPGRMRRLDEMMADRSFWKIFFLKFFPVVPFRFLDLAAGLTRIPLKRYLLISAVASPLRLFVIQFFIAIGVDTVLNPVRLSAYLQDNPVIFFAVGLYLAGAVIMVFVLGKKSPGPPKAS